MKAIAVYAISAVVFLVAFGLACLAVGQMTKRGWIEDFAVRLTYVIAITGVLSAITLALFNALGATDDYSPWSACEKLKQESGETASGCPASNSPETDH